MRLSLKRMFINDCYGGDYTKYLRSRREDYFKVQFEWTCYINTLCKNGVITQKQYERATF